MNLIPAYAKLGQYDSALAVANRCIETYNARGLVQVGIVIRAFSARGDVYKDMGDYERAEADYVQTYDMVLEAVGTERAKSWRMDIGQLLILKGQYAEALTHMLVATEDYTADQIPEAWVAYGDIAKCYQELGDHENALLYTQKVLESREEMYEAKIKGLEDENLARYESGKKDEAIAQLDERTKQDQRIKLLAFGLVAVFALLLAGLTFFFFRNQKINRQLSSLNENLAQSNQDKELLLKEIHHRVKNNLQTISSLLYLQSAHIKDQSVREAVAKGQHRVESMALIHQKLYQRDNLAAIEMKDYLSNLGQSLISTFAVDPEQINLVVEMDELELDVDSAVPIGLIVNELLTNSLKYAFPDEKKGTIQISLHLAAPDKLQLVVRDNGKGSITDEPAKGTGFGSQLVQLLSTQLEGNLETETENGYLSRLTFTKFQTV